MNLDVNSGRAMQATCHETWISDTISAFAGTEEKTEKHRFARCKTSQIHTCLQQAVQFRSIKNKLARRNSRIIGENESHGDTETPGSEVRNSITSVEVPPSRLFNMVDVYPCSI